MGSCDQVSLPSKAMESFKVSVCMCLLVGLAQSAPQNTNEVVRTVTTQLQPLISDAVARALAGLNTVSASSSRFGSSSSFGASSGAAVARGSGLSEEEELEYNRKLSENAAYEYGYKVANDESQTYMAHEETRDGAMSRENTTTLTALELLSLSPTRLDLRDTQRPEMSRRELLR